jgi:hypothetical protein
MRGTAAVLALAMVFVLAPTVAGETVDGTDQVADECSPPCGEINPRISFAFADMGEDPITLEEGESVTFEGEVVYWTDTDDEGHAPHDATEDIVIRFSFPRLPTWASMSVEPAEITVPVSTCPDCFQTNTEGSSPATHYEYREPVTLTVTANEAPQATTGYDYGKLQLFAKSTESGIYNPGYGIREVRVDPGASASLEQQSTDSPMPVPGAGALAALATLGAAAVAVRKRS